MQYSKDTDIEIILVIRNQVVKLHIIVYGSSLKVDKK